MSELELNLTLFYTELSQLLPVCDRQTFYTAVRSGVVLRLLVGCIFMTTTFCHAYRYCCR